MRMQFVNPRFCTLSDLTAYLAAKPAGVNPVLPLYPLGSDGNDSNRIGHWGRDAAGVVVAQGPINTARLSSSMSGLAASTAGGVVTLAAGHNITRTSGIIRIWDRTGANEFGDYSYTRVGDNLTIGAIAAAIVQVRLIAGAVVEMIDVGTCEFCIGGSTRVIRPLALGKGSIVYGTGIVATGNVTIFPGWSPPGSDDWFLSMNVTYTRSSSEDNQKIKFGAWQSSLKHSASGLQRIAGADTIRPSYGAIAAPTETNLVDDSAGGTYPFTRIKLRVDCSGGGLYLTSITYPTLRRTILVGLLTAAPTGILIRTAPGAAETLTGCINSILCG